MIQNVYNHLDTLSKHVAVCVDSQVVDNIVKALGSRVLNQNHSNGGRVDGVEGFKIGISVQGQSLYHLKPLLVVDDVVQ